MNDVSSPSVSAPSAMSCRESCCAAEPAPAAAAFHPERTDLIRRAFRLEYATVVWMVIEAAVAVWSGVQAASVSLLAFGIDSLIELASAGVLIWRLMVELRHGQAFAEKAEARRAAPRADCCSPSLVTWSLQPPEALDPHWPDLLLAGAGRHRACNADHVSSRPAQDRSRRRAGQPGYASRRNGKRDMRLVVASGCGRPSR